MAVLSDPERLWQQPLIQVLAARMELTQASDLLIPTTLVFASAAVLAALIRMTNLLLNASPLRPWAQTLAVRPIDVPLSAL